MADRVIASRPSLNALVAANLIGSTVHFADNALRFPHYPEPAWITGPGVVVGLWLAITPLLLAGWWLARRGRFGLALTALWSYAGLSMFVLGHYAYAPPSTLLPSLHIGIVANALVAIALLLGAPQAIRMRGT